MSKLRRTIDKESIAFLDSLPKREDNGNTSSLLIATEFSRLGRISQGNGYVFGGWSPSFPGACGPAMVRGIPIDSIIQLIQQGGCPDGEPIVVCYHY